MEIHKESEGGVCVCVCVSEHLSNGHTWYAFNERIQSGYLPAN